MGHHCGKNKEYMRVTMAKYFQTNVDGVNIVAADYLWQKGQTLDDYIEVSAQKGDELAVHVLACMTSFKIIVVTKTGFWSTVVDWCFISRYCSCVSWKIHV